LFAPTASASEIIDRNVQNVRLGVDASGQALVTYKIRGRVMHVRVWGAVDARQPTMSRPQVRFRKDYGFYRFSPRGLGNGAKYRLSGDRPRCDT
jgi:hypothetical protein